MSLARQLSVWSVLTWSALTLAFCDRYRCSIAWCACSSHFHTYSLSSAWPAVLAPFEPAQSWVSTVMPLTFRTAPGFSWCRHTHHCCALWPAARTLHTTPQPSFISRFLLISLSVPCARTASFLFPHLSGWSHRLVSQFGHHIFASAFNFHPSRWRTK